MSTPTAIFNTIILLLDPALIETLLLIKDGLDPKMEL
jgi:hypothetical protein